MEQAIGVVLETKGKTAKVRIDRKSMCGDSCSNCTNLCGIRDTVLQVQNTAGAAEGDTVSVAIPTRKGVLAMLITYGVPLIYALIITVLMAAFLTEKVGAILLLGGIALWFGALWLLEKKGIFFTVFKTEITGICEQTNKI